MLLLILYLAVHTEIDEHAPIKDYLPSGVTAV